jgi:2-polyprenyl-3-methyl-5-hydroxy-6-metoxy-1,4-benzoquinol methylase
VRLSDLRLAAKTARDFALDRRLNAILAREELQPRALNERPVEYRYAIDRLVKAEARSVLDVGTGTTAWPAILADAGYQVTAIDDPRVYWGGRLTNRHWRVQMQSIITTTLPASSFDAVTCISVLEHIPEHQAAMAAMLRLVKPGGIVILTGPWNETSYVPDAYRMPGAGYGQREPYITQVFSAAQLAQWEAAGGETINREYHQVFTGPLWTQGKRLRPPQPASVDSLHHLACITLRRV